MSSENDVKKAVAGVTANDGKPILKLNDKTGDWTYGQNNDVLPAGTLLAVIFIVGAHIWYQTPWGRHMVAIGGAREAAKADRKSVV